ncbi:ABC transporter permease [Thermotoga sp.]|uniref:ABC transporter permease n=1 Tax=Thermotoga sp. TaxID=28240 RepID=UPI0025CF0E86|nr:ABC transporter permease [Thermotoga sp.]
MGDMVRSLHLAKASFLSAKRYRIDWYGSFLTPLLTIIPVVLLFYLGSKSGLVQFFYGATNTENIIGYLLLGAAYWNYVEVLWGTVFTLRYYMRIGQLEEILTMPISTLGYIFSWSVFGLVKVTIESVPIIVLAILMNFMTLSPIGFALAAGVVILSIVASFGFVFLFFGVTLRFKEGDELVGLLGNAAPLIGGMFFPVSILSKGLMYLSFAFPFTWGLDLTRHFLMNTNTLLNPGKEFIILTVLSLLYLGLGAFSFRVLQNKARRKGMQGF